ncbi:MAG: TetR/AcrR family transcriptional regulator [Xanthobacteraceae bacterium]|uniref:TetR/AcrR family transcriptional regulator n=1 Tax=Pseudolabrys sp. TaxID=1960880 RepID=UPI003D0A1B3C
MAKKPSTTGRGRRKPSASRSAAAPSAAGPAAVPGKRETILAAALEEFSARGFADTRLDDVARRAGVAKGTIYLYFRDKQDLFQELVRGMLTPVVGNIAAMGAADVPIHVLGEQIAEMFAREVYNTHRRDVIRLMIAEGPRFPELAEFYYREVLSQVMTAMRALLERAAARGEVSGDLARFPQIVASAGVVAIVWNGLFERFAPLDVEAMMKAHMNLLFPKKPS